MKKLFILFSLALVSFFGLVNNLVFAYGETYASYNVKSPTGKEDFEMVKGEMYAILTKYQDIEEIANAFMYYEEVGMIDMSEYIIESNFDKIAAELYFKIGTNLKSKMIEESNKYQQDYEESGWFFVKSQRTGMMTTILEGMTETRTIWQLVLDDTSVEGDGNLVLDYDSNITLAMIKKRYSAHDNYDGDITDRIKFETDYPENYGEVLVNHEYYIKASVSDTAGNEISVKNTITVYDHTKPVFSGKNSFTFDYGTSFTFDNIFSEITCIDNYDKSIDKESFKIKDNKQIDYRCLEVQKFIVYVTDSSSNEATYEIEVLIVDNEKPVITIGDIVGASVNNPLSKEKIATMLKNKNLIPNDAKSVEIVSEYFGNETKVGDYIATCQVTFADDSVQAYRFTISVVDSNIKDTNNILYITLAVLSGVAIIGFGFYFYRRKKIIK